MKSFNNELMVHRGESFTIDRLLQNKDGSPYIISKRLSNPYYLITVSNTRYEQDGRYKINYWLNLADSPRFNITIPVNLLGIVNANNEQIYHAWSDISALSTITVDGKTIQYVAGGYDKNTDANYYLEPDDCVFYIEHDDGSREYKYWNDGWTDYECRLVHAFLREDTADWIEQSYLYSIQLVSGQDMLSYLRNICTVNSIQFSNTDDVATLYEKAKSYLQDDFNYTRPIATLDVLVPILVPTKISVLSNLQGV